MTERRGPLLLVDDDTVFGAVVSRALRARGMAVFFAQDAEAAVRIAQAENPHVAVVDLKLGAENGLVLIPRLLSAVPDMRILLLTGYASIATAVEAIKRGAHNYLAKPVDAEAIVKALFKEAEASSADEATAIALPLKRLEWEHIQRVLAESEGNVSETARRLGLHRRTLQRKLMKRPVRERPMGED